MAKYHIYEGPMFSTSIPKVYFENLAEIEIEFSVETLDLVVTDNFVTHVSKLEVIPIEFQNYG